MYPIILIFFFATTLLIGGCLLDDKTFAPVSNVTTIESVPKSGTHTVTRHETLYSIAWRYGLDYRYLAKRNRISSPYPIHVGQTIFLTNRKLPSTIQSREPAISALRTPVMQKKPTHIEKEPTASVSNWQWPAKGSVIGTFSSLNKGINIGGQLGEPVVSTAAGKVVYSGDGLTGYGNLIIIKHNSTFLTAYAHNSVVFVSEGQWVKKGQKIAEMGKTGTNRIMLHFEIRRNGKPVNPLQYLT